MEVVGSSPRTAASRIPLAGWLALALAGVVAGGAGACGEFDATAGDDAGVAEGGAEGGVGPEGGAGAEGGGVPDAAPPPGPCMLPPLGTVDMLVNGETEIVALTADPTNVFWATTANGGEIRTRPRVVSAAATTTVVTGAPSQNVSALIMVGTVLTWTSGGAERKLLSFPPGGGAPTDIYDSVNGSTGHLEAYDNNTVIFARTTGLLRCPVGVAGCGAIPVTLDGANLGTSVFAYTSPFLFFLAPTASSNGIYGCRASSCTDAGAPIADSQGDVTVMTSDADAAYVASSTGSTIRRIGRDGASFVLATGIEPTSMSAMDKNLLVATSKGLLAVPKTGGCIDTLALGKFTHVVERGGVAFAVQNDGEILRIPPRVP